MAENTKKLQELISKRDNLIEMLHGDEIKSIRWNLDEKIKKRIKEKRKNLMKQKKASERKAKEKKEYIKRKKEEAKKRAREKEWERKEKEAIQREAEKKQKELEKKNANLIKKKEMKIDKEISLEQLRRERQKEKELLEKEHLKKKKESLEVDKGKEKTSIVKEAKEKNLERKSKKPKHTKEESQEEIEEIMKEELKIDKKISLEQLKELRKKEKEKEKLRKKQEAEEKKLIEKKTKLQAVIIDYAKDIENLRKEVSKTVVGHEEVVTSLIRGFLANGHVLIEGVPGIAKTLLIRTLANASGCNFSRIQFTVDLLPTDITGVTTYDEKTNQFSTIKGPIFANFVIGDEINRAPPKTQSALLEAMQERQVTIGKETHKVPSPFFVMANNNPLESSGTYPLPEAQVDRFLFKIIMGYTSEDEEVEIIDKNITVHDFKEFNVKPVINAKKILQMQATTKEIIATKKIKEYIVRIVDATRNPKKYGIKLGKYIEWGCSPRASIGVTIAAKADALINGSYYITPQNVRNVVHDVLRHRLILNYRGQAENIKSDDIITEILNKVPLP